VDTTIGNDGKAVVITQSFVLPQGQYNVTRPNSSVHVTRGYVGDDPMFMPAIAFKNLIMEPQGFNVPCTMDAPLFGQTRSTLNLDDLFLDVQCCYGRMWRNGLWARLQNLVCPIATQDQMLSIRNVRQEGVDQSG
jgi:hypothetical protein